MKKLFVLFALTAFTTLTAQAQKVATWKGGTPGRPSDWNCPTNWKEGRVPDEFSQVIIPEISTSTFSYPVLDKGEVEVESLSCSPGARLTLKNKARVLVLEPSNFGEQIREQSQTGMAAVFGRDVRFGN